MYRLILVMVAAFVFAGCSGGESDGGSAEVGGGAPVGQPPSTPGTEAVSEPDLVPAPEGIRIAPYFDDEGTVRMLAVKPGATFDLYVFAEIEGAMQVSAAQYSVDLPPGVEVLSEKKIHDKSLTMGDVRENFMVSFGCHDPGRFYVMRYTCQTSEGFEGGRVVVRPGVNAQGQAFLGYASCGQGVTPEMVPAGGAGAQLTRAR